ncbi:MAG TPA: VOC family protein [Thermoplasmata archaeon]|jgi:predicted enzyme related to lactoylglutathione lyase|nr:VOC family protein [Thermoplasmata archaeon]
MAKEAQMVTLIPVRNMDRAIKFYTKVLGGKLGDRGMGPMKDFWASATVGGADVWFVAPEEREKRKLAYQTLLVKDLRKYVALLKKRGVKFEKAPRMSPETKVEGPIAFDTFGASAFFKDTEGNLLMAWQNFPGM